MVAPPLIALIILTLNWRWIFFLTSAAGLVWALVWWLFYNLPAQEGFITPEELEHIQQSLARARLTDTAAAKDRIDWIDLFKYRQLWVLLAAKFFTDAVWFFFIFWLPKYLGDVRHLNIKQIGYYAWIPYALAGAEVLPGAG